MAERLRPKIYNSFREGDVDSAALRTAAAGAAIAGVFLVSGPVGWALLGASVVAGLLADVAQDTNRDQLLNFSAFGTKNQESNTLLEQDRAWTMATAWTDWNRDTEAGLITWMRAAQQLMHSFSVKGADMAVGQSSFASDVRVELAFSYLQPSSKIILWVKNEYSSIPSVDVLVRLDVDDEGKTAKLEDGSGAFQPWEGPITESGATSTFTVLLRLPVLGTGMPPATDIRTSTVLVQLFVLDRGVDATGNLETLIVPTTKAGVKWVEASVVRVGKAISDDRFTSYTNKFLV